MDTMNAELPAGVRVSAGADPTLPLRAWYVSVACGDGSGRVEVLVSDDTEDRRETVSSFAADTSACVVIDEGYFSTERMPVRHAGLFVIDGVHRGSGHAIGSCAPIEEDVSLALGDWGVMRKATSPTK